MWRVFFAMFRGVPAAGFWIEQHFTRAGLLVLGGLVAGAVFGVDTSLNVAYRLFTLCAALLLLAAVMARFGKPSLAVQPRLPHTLTAGEPFLLRLEVRNTSSKRVEGVAVRADLGDPRPSFAEFRARLRLPTYRGWTRLVWSNRTAYVEEATLPALGADSEAQVELRGQALRRGRLHLGGIHVAHADPLGLFRRLTATCGPADICVLPKRYRLPPLSLPGARRYQPGGMPQGASVGDSEEFLGLRDYRPGDPLQRIHWRSFARTGKPVIREYQDEYVARYALMLDTFVIGRADERVREAFEEAVAVAASFAWTLDTRECLLDLMFVGTEIFTYTAGRGHLLPVRLLEVLAGVQMQADRDFTGLTNLVRARRDQLSGCVCVLLTWDEQREALVAALRATGAVVLPLVVCAQAPGELPPGVRLLRPGRITEDLAGL
jgi:uncharacterized protein (DUF58 family)